jgi:dTDP-4-dehydrorhamnose reductase
MNAIKIVITGAGGQLGQELTAIIDDGRADIGSIPDVYRNAQVIAMSHKALDIANREQVDTFIANETPDIIFNCAAMTDVDGCEKQSDLAYAVNMNGPSNLACSLAKYGGTLVHLSTDYVFSGTDPTPRSESDQTNPQNAYGASKLAGEMAISTATNRHFIVRSSWLYGHTEKNFVKTILRLARETGTVKVVNDQHGNPTYANDLAYELLKLALTDEYGIYHVTGNGICSWFEFASAIVDAAGIPCEKIPCTTAEFPRLAKRPIYSALDNARLRNTIGDEMRHWRKALASFLEDE